MVKLAGVLFQEKGTGKDIEESNELLVKAVGLEPDNTEALLLQGKIDHKLGLWQKSIDALERAIKVQAEDQS